MPARQKYGLTDKPNWKRDSFLLLKLYKLFRLLKNFSLHILYAVDLPAGCEECPDGVLIVEETFADYCYPSVSDDQTECACVCDSLVCDEDQVIDQTTCSNEGTLSDCSCIEAYDDY